MGKLCTHVYNLVKESAIAMTLLNTHTHTHSSGHSNSRVLLEFDVLKFSFLSNLSEEGHEDLKQDAIFPLIGEKESSQILFIKVGVTVVVLLVGSHISRPMMF